MFRRNEVVSAIMPVVRLLLAGLVVLAALAMVVFAAAAVFLAGVAVFVLQLLGLRKRPPPVAPPPPAGRAPRVMRDADAIDVETTKIPADRPKI